MTTQIWIPSIAAAASLLVALVSALIARRTQHRMTELTSRLEEQRAERNARRDYEYEAKKRLYTECEPVLFEAMELAETFQRRVRSLARAARKGGVQPDGSGWLTSNGYYIRSTAYYLLAPAASMKILQRRLTAIDLDVEPRIRFQYRLLKEIFDSYTWDYELAGASPDLSYDPDLPTVQAGRRQGLYRGAVDQIADSLIDKSGDTYRCKSLGEFWKELDEPQSPIGQQSTEIITWITGFHPMRMPILWRVLVSQYLLCGVLLQSRDVPPGVHQVPAQLLISPDEALRQGLDWQPEGDVVSSAYVHTPVVVGHSYVSKRLSGLVDNVRQ